MNKDNLKKNYENVCNGYLVAFYKKHGFDFKDARWIADRPGEIAEVADYCVDMQTIIDDINLDAKEDEFIKWYDYCQEMQFLGAETTPNFMSWINGCPRKSESEIKHLKLLHKRVEELKNELINEIKKQ